MELEGNDGFSRSAFKFIIPIQGIDIQVASYKLINSKADKRSTSLRNIHRCDDQVYTPVNKPDWCPHCERIVGSDELIKGYDMGDGDYKYIDADEISAIKKGMQSEYLEIIGFVDSTNMDPEFVKDAYVLVPKAASTAKKSMAVNDKLYGLLANSLNKKGGYIVARFFSGTNEFFTAITGRSVNGENMLFMYSLYYADEVRNPDSLGFSNPSISTAEQEKMDSLIDKKVRESDVDYSELDSVYRQEFARVLDAREAGDGDIPPPPPPEAADDTSALLDRALSFSAPKKKSNMGKAVGVVATIGILFIIFGLLNA